MPAYNKHQFQALLGSPEVQAVGSAVDSGDDAAVLDAARAVDLRSAIDSPTGQLPLFMQAKDLKPLVKPLEGDRHLTDRLPTDSPELGQTHGYDERNRYETDDEMWDRKLAESGEADERNYGEEGLSLREDIARHGMYRPVRVRATDYTSRTGWTTPAGTVGNGHHRIAVMAADHPESWVPVEWDDSNGSLLAGGTDGDDWHGPNTQQWLEGDVMDGYPGRPGVFHVEGQSTAGRRKNGVGP